MAEHSPEVLDRLIQQSGAAWGLGNARYLQADTVILQTVETERRGGRAEWNIL